MLSQTIPQCLSCLLNSNLAGTVPRARVRLGLEPADSAESTSRTLARARGRTHVDRWISIGRPAFALSLTDSISRIALRSRSDGSQSSSSPAPRARVRERQGVGRGRAAWSHFGAGLNGSPSALHLLHVPHRPRSLLPHLLPSLVATLRRGEPGARP